RVATPMLPPHLFRVQAFTGSVIFGVLINIAYCGIIFLLNLFLQEAQAFSAAEAGLAFIPLTGPLIAANLVAGAMVARFGPRLPMCVGAILSSAGCALLAGVASDTHFVAMLPGLIFIPAGLGLTVPALTAAVLGSVTEELSGTATGALSSARQAAAALG